MAALKGTRRLSVPDQSGFRIGMIVLIHDLFAALIVAYRSIIVDRPVDRDYLSSINRLGIDSTR